MTARAWVTMAFTAALWGASYLFIKVALDGGLSEGVIIVARTVLGAMVLVPLALRAGAWPAIRARPGWTLALAVAQVILPFGLITFGENYVPSALAGILIASSPLFVALLALRLDRDERSQGWGLVGVLLGMIGVVVLFGVDLSGNAETIAGGLMILGAALSYAFAVLIVKRGFTGVPPVGVAASTMVVSAVAWLPVAVASPPASVPDADVIAAVVALGAGGTGVAFYFFYTSIAEVGPARASVVAYIAPAFAVVYGATLLGEDVTIGTVAGLALILAGSWLAARAKAAPAARAPAVSRSAPCRSTAPEPARAR